MERSLMLVFPEHMQSVMGSQLFSKGSELNLRNCKMHVLENFLTTPETLVACFYILCIYILQLFLERFYIKGSERY